jgi:DNA polymerase III delta prime subunit
MFLVFTIVCIIAFYVAHEFKKPNSKIKFIKEKKKYWKYMEELGYDYYDIKIMLREIRSYDELVIVNRKLEKALKRVKI